MTKLCILEGIYAFSVLMTFVAMLYAIQTSNEPLGLFCAVSCGIFLNGFVHTHDGGGHDDPDCLS